MTARMAVLLAALQEVGAYDADYGNGVHAVRVGTNPETLLVACRIAQRAAGENEFKSVAHMGFAMEARLRRDGEHAAADQLRSWLRDAGYDWIVR